MTTTTMTKRRAPELPPSSAATWRNVTHPIADAAAVDSGGGSECTCSISDESHFNLTVMLPDGRHVTTEVDAKY
jgi:hypothetical protein